MAAAAKRSVKNLAKANYQFRKRADQAILRLISGCFADKTGEMTTKPLNFSSILDLLGGHIDNPPRHANGNGYW
jgi:hypothetical protein